MVRIYEIIIQAGEEILDEILLFGREAFLPTEYTVVLIEEITAYMRKLFIQKICLEEFPETNCEVICWFTA